MGQAGRHEADGPRAGSALCPRRRSPAAGNRVRVTAQLINAETDTHLWAERFAGDAGDLFAWQDEITNRIAVALDLELLEAQPPKPPSATTQRLLRPLAQCVSTHGTSSILLLD